MQQPRIALALALIAACASPEVSATVESAAEPARAFAQRIPGTTVEIEMLPVPPGAADAERIWMSATEVTWDAYDAFVFGLDQPAGGEADAVARPSKPYITMDRGFGHAGYPAISMSFAGAKAFCAWLSARTGRRYRLPSEDEWQRACLAGASGAWCTAGDRARLADHAWLRENAERKTHAVGTKQPNAWGLFDLHGNAAEWCVRAVGPEASEAVGVVCGGSYHDSAEGVAASARVAPSAAWNASDPQVPKSRWWLADGGFVGFRIVCEGPLEEERAR